MTTETRSTAELAQALEKWLTESTTLGELAATLREAATRLREQEQALTLLRDLAYDDCLYGDNCPDFFGTRHGRCLPCKARVALADGPDKEP